MPPALDRIGIMARAMRRPTRLRHALVAALLVAALAAPRAAAALTVDVDLFVMSKCPDAVYCEAALAPVLQELRDATSLTMHWIATQQSNGTWACKHGPSECAGDLQQLCVQQEAAPGPARLDWLLRFVLCTNAAGMEAQGQLITAARCLKDAGVPFVPASRMLACMYGPGSSALLAKEFALTSALGVATSCTVRVEGNTVCVRDDGRWRDCPAGSRPSDFRDVICASYAAKSGGKLPPACPVEPGAAPRGAAAA